MKALTWRRLVIAGAAILITFTAAFVLWLFAIYREMASRFDSAWFLPPVEFYAAGKNLRIGMKINVNTLREGFVRRGFREHKKVSVLRDDDFAIWDQSACRSIVPEPFSEDVKACLVWRSGPRTHGPARVPRVALATLTADYVVTALFEGEPLQPVISLSLEPELFAQFYEGQPVLRELVHYGEAPLMCLQAITAIEDRHFLDHRGVSISGLGRALFRNLRAGRVAEGGSTITQQLVKNYFLTSERSFRRKFKELFMAVILESHLEKEAILENYLNVVYMGQNGPFQIRGYGAAARFYFGRNLSDLELSECALLAALVNSPGRFNPFLHPDNAKERRDRVIDRMAELELIAPEQMTLAIDSPLPKKPPRPLTEPAPYYIQATLKALSDLGIQADAGLRVFTGLDLAAQEAAHKAVRKGLSDLTEQMPPLKKYKSEGKPLEATLIAVDTESATISALIGGRDFKVSQFNRAISAQRQVGSVMKPFVYLAALESLTPAGEPYTPLTPINDVRFNHRFEGQSWSPQNYDRKFRGQVPLYVALKDSLNASAARLAIDVGLSHVIDIARRAGLKSDLKSVPSLALGAFEMRPIEVAEAYSTLARFGRHSPLSLIKSVENYEGAELYRFEPQTSQSFAPETVAVLTGMLKQTLHSGSGQSIPTWRGFTHPAAGKTGTTSDLHDAWFVGYTPYVLAVAWVGFDDNTPTGLTGASGAIPIWTDFMKGYAATLPPDDFKWPDGTSLVHLSRKQLEPMMGDPEFAKDLVDADLVFQKGTEPDL